MFKKILLLSGLLAMPASFISCNAHVSPMGVWGAHKFVNTYANLSYQDEVKTAKLINEIDYNVKTSNAIYQMLVYAFADGNHDGIGDFIGAKEKLSYIKSLGFDAIWLSPIHPASSYHGYDVIDYVAVAPELGGMQAFEAFLKKAHKLNIKIYLDMVFNHTSYEHPWFQAALKDKNSKYRNFYHFETATSHYPDANKLGYDQVAKFVNLKTKLVSSEKYISKFWGGMPDLNLDNHDVITELANIQRFWVKKGIDGFRYDAFSEYFSSMGETQTNYNASQILMVLRKAGARGAHEVHRDVRFKQFMIGEWWSTPRAAGPYYLNEGMQALNTVYDGVWKKDWWTKMTYASMLENVQYLHAIKDKHNNHFASWVPFIDNHDSTRWLNSYLLAIENQAPDAIAQPMQLSNTAIAAMKIAIFSLMIRPATPIIYQGVELAYHGNKKYGDAGMREPLKWSNGKFNVHFYEKRSGATNNTIRLFFSTNRLAADKQIREPNSPAYLVKKMNAWRIKHQFIGQTDPRTIEDYQAYFTFTCGHVTSEAFIRKDIHNNNKFLIIFSLNKPLQGQLKTTYKNIIMQSSNVSIQAQDIFLGKYAFVIFKL